MSAQLLTVTEVRAALKRSKTSVYRMFESGELAWVQVGAHRRVTADELNRFIAANTRIAS